MTRQRLTVLLLALFFFHLCFSQDGNLQLYQNGYYIKQYSEVAGLVNNQCKFLFEDSKGFLWISTFQGLSRFDGRKFTNYELKQGLPSLDISEVCEDSSGLIYVATTKGIARYTGFNGKNDSCFFVYKQTTGMGSPISGMQAIDSNTIIFQRRGDGLFLLHKNNLTVLWKKTLQHVRSILKDRDNNIYVYTMDTIRVYNKYLQQIRDVYFPNTGYIGFYNDNHTDFIQAYSNEKVYHLNIEGLTADSNAPDSVVWFCKTNAERKMFYVKGRTELRFYDGTASKSIFDLKGLTLYANSLLQTSDKSIWLSTSAGGIFRITKLPYNEIRAPNGGYTTTINNRIIFKSDSELVRRPYIAATYKQLKDIVIRSVFVSKTGVAWFCTGNGIYKQGPGNKAEHYSFDGGDEVNYGPVAKEIRGVVEDGNEDLWFYGYSGVIHYSNGKFKQYTSRHGLNRDILVRQLVIDKTGTVLLTDFFNLFKLQGDTLLPVGKELGLPNYIPSKIKTDNNGFTWIDYNKSLFKIEKKQSGKYAITDSLVLHAQASISEITKFGFDAQNNCWIGFAGGKIGVFFADNEGHYNYTNSITYTSDDGVTFATSNDYSLLPDQDGNTVIIPRKSGNEKLFIFSTADALERKLLKMPQLSLTGIFINHKIPDWLDMGYVVGSGGYPISPRLHHKNNNIRFDYTGILLSNSSDVVYQVMLKGYDHEWRTTSEVSAAYTNLPAGSYTFLIKAANANGVWSEPIEYSFTILLPWFKTREANALWFLSFCSIVIFLFWLRVRAIRRADALNNLKKSDLFKSRLIGLIGHDMLTPIRYISKVALQLQTHNEKLSKKTTIESLGEINATATQLYFFGENIVHWIKLQGEGFTPQIQKFDLAYLVEELVSVHMPLITEKKNQIINEITSPLYCTQDPMLIKIIIHNLLLNANKFTSSGIIKITAKTANKWLTLYVQDNGRGMDKDKEDSLNRLQPISSSEGTQNETGWGMGYILITDLLKLSGGDLLVQSQLDKGTIVTVKLPIETDNDWDDSTMN